MAIRKTTTRATKTTAPKASNKVVKEQVAPTVQNNEELQILRAELNETQNAIRDIAGSLKELTEAVTTLQQQPVQQVTPSQPVETLTAKQQQIRATQAISNLKITDYSTKEVRHRPQSGKTVGQIPHSLEDIVKAVTQALAGQTPQQAASTHTIDNALAGQEIPAIAPLPKDFV